MPDYSRGKKRLNLTYVAINPQLYFAFKTKDLGSIPGVSDTDLVALGHIQSSAVPAGKIRVLGASSPKPPRVSKRLPGPVTQQGSVNTYCAPDKLSEALAAGFNRSKRGNLLGLKAASDNQRTQSVIAELSDGALYVFPLNSADFSLYGQAFGLQAATSITTDAEKQRVVRGSTIPKPGKAKIDLDTGASFSTFYGKNASFNIPGANVSVLSAEEILTVAAPGG